MLTIDQTVQLLAIIFFAGLALFLVVGLVQLRAANRLPYFMLRRRRTSRGWRLLALALVLGLAGLATQLYGRQAAYVIVPPTPSSTPTSTATPTPSITPTASITPTPSITPTASITPIPTASATPELPERITVLFRETITPQPDAAFSALEFSGQLGFGNLAVNPRDEFVQPEGRLYGAFSYNFLEDGARWTAIWYLDGEVVCLETQPWDGGTGGYGFTDCEPENGWQPGNYEVQMFLGETWKESGRFRVLSGTPTPSPSPSASPTQSATPLNSVTPTTTEQPAS